MVPKIACAQARGIISDTGYSRNRHKLRLASQRTTHTFTCALASATVRMPVCLPEKLESPARIIARKLGKVARHGGDQKKPYQGDDTALGWRREKLLAGVILP